MTAGSPRRPADVTCLSTVEGWLYLAVVMHLAGHRIVGWSMSDRPNAELVCQALQIGTRSLGGGWRRFAVLARDGRWGAPQLLRDFSNSLAAGTQQRSLLSLNRKRSIDGVWH